MERVLTWSVFIALCAVVSVASPQATISGHWEGPSKIPQMELKVLVDLVQHQDGSWTGTIGIPARSAKGLF